MLAFAKLALASHSAHLMLTCVLFCQILQPTQQCTIPPASNLSNGFVYFGKVVTHTEHAWSRNALNIPPCLAHSVMYQNQTFEVSLPKYFVQLMA